MARGGVRPGAGRPKKGVKTAKAEALEAAARQVPDLPVAPPEPGEEVSLTPLEYMLRVMNDPKADDARRDRMAQAAAPFVHARSGENTKRDERSTAAKKVAAGGRFTPLEPPKLVVSNA